MLGKLLFYRAGVKIRANPSFYKKGIADKSTLYWSHRRKYRETNDLSIGWGGNSQWKTKFRLDFDLENKYIYNY